MLNWTPEVIVNGLAAIILLLLNLLSRREKTQSLIYFKLVIYLIAAYSIFEALSDLFLLRILYLLGYITLFPLSICTIMLVNYATKDTYFSLTLLLTFAIGPIFILLIFQTDSTILVVDDIYLYYTNSGWGLIGEFFFFGIFGIYVFYWGLKTYLNATLLIKKESLIFFIGMFLVSGIGVILNMFSVISRYFVLVSLIISIIGAIILLISIELEPKLLYILPFIVYRLIVKDRDGYPLYDHDWSDSEINEILFSGFINAVQHMSKEVMDVGGLLDINMEKGIMILHHSRNITVGLVASKSSKLLRESLLKFSMDFETKFKFELNQSIKDMNAYSGACELIQKYFSNFPYRIFTSKKQPLLLSGKFTQIPKELDEKIKTIFPDEKDYEFIKSELLKVPLYTYSEFENLYNELQDEMKKITKKEFQFLDGETN
jgi:hypothetical protein